MSFGISNTSSPMLFKNVNNIHVVCLMYMRKESKLGVPPKDTAHSMKNCKK